MNESRDDLINVSYWAGVFYDRDDNFEIAEIIVDLIKEGLDDEY